MSSESKSDCESLISNSMDIPTLLQEAEKHPDCARLVDELCRQKFAEKYLRISRSFNDGSSDIKDWGKIVEINNATLAEELMQKYGQGISSVRISLGSESNGAAKKIITILNRSNKALKHLKLSSEEPDVFSDVNQPFDNVEYLLLNDKFAKVESKTLKFNEMFPKLKHLQLTGVALSEKGSLGVHFSNLVELGISPSSKRNIFDDDVKELIKMNPQVRKLDLSNIPIELVKFCSENFHDLDSIKLLHVPKNSDQIRFEKVKRVQVDWALENFSHNMDFGQLEEFDINGDTPLIDEWVNFVARHTTLQKYRIQEWIHDKHLKMLIGKHPNLVEASFTLAADVKADTIIAFMQASSYLQKITIWHGKSDNLDYMAPFPSGFEQQIKGKLSYRSHTSLYTELTKKSEFSEN